jgi:hypothetical protein
MYTNTQFSDVLQQQQQQNSTTYTAADVRNAKERLIKAAEATHALEQEAKKPIWRQKSTHDDLRNRLNQAKQEEDLATQNFNKVFRSAGWLEAQEKHAARVAEQERRAKEEQKQRAEAMEQEAKRQFRDLYLGNGGTETQFESAWPSMWQSELERRTVAGRYDL